MTDIQHKTYLIFIILYFSILLHCSVHGYCRLCFRLSEALLCWFSLSITTCFGLHGHLQVYRIFIFICLQDSASLLFVAFLVRFLFFATKSSEAESFKHMKINILYTWRWPCRPKHVVKDSENQHNKAARRRKHNLQYPLILNVFVL
jgi:hypothetical protein